MSRYRHNYSKGGAMQSSISSEVDRIYYNIQIQDGIARFEENRLQPLIDRPQDYYVSIVKFTVPLQSVPVQIIKKLPASSDPNQTIFSITIQYGGMPYTVNLEYIPEEDVSVGSLTYYFQYSYSAFIRMMNVALAQAVTNASLAGTFAGSPFFKYDPNTQLISLIVPYSWRENASPIAGAPQVFVNSFLAQRIIGMYQEYTNINTELSNRIYLIDKGYNYPSITGVTIQMLEMTEDFTALNYWGSARSLQFVTGTIPVVNEFVSAITRSSISNNESGTVKSRPILTDFTLTEANFAGSNRGWATFTNSGPYRLCDMNNSAALSKIDLSVYWVDYDNNIYPIVISDQDVLEVKLMFIKKTSVCPSDFKMM